MSDTKRTTTPDAEEIIGSYFPVLDHGFVSLVDYMGGDISVERAARVSYGHGTRATSHTRGLIRYLHRHQHTTPSEMVEFVVHCGMPIFVARQWIRHRTASVNEYSGRYSLIPTVFYTPSREQVQSQGKTNKQGGSGAQVDSEIYNRALHEWHGGREAVVRNYSWLIENDVAREISRIDLPLSTYTQWYWKIDLHNLLHFLRLRVDPHAQWEIREYAKIIAGMVKRVAPLSFEAWVDFDLKAKSFSRMEMAALRKLVTCQGGGLRTKDASLTGDELAALGLSEREIKELVAKIEATNLDLDFDLDLGRAKGSEHFFPEGIKASGE